MSNYRNLTQNEIEILENNVCWAEDWQRVLVAEDFLWRHPTGIVPQDGGGEQGLPEAFRY